MLTVHVKELPSAQQDEQSKQGLVPDVQTMPHLGQAVQSIMGNTSYRVFELTWHGKENEPQRVNIAGTEIGFARSGILFDTNGYPIGTYEDVLTGNEQGTDQHKMVVHLNPKNDLPGGYETDLTVPDPEVEDLCTERLNDPDLRLNVNFPPNFDAEEFITLSRTVVRLFIDAVRDREGRTIDHFDKMKAFIDGAELSTLGDDPNVSTTQFFLHSVSDMHLGIYFDQEMGNKIGIYAHYARPAPDRRGENVSDERMRECIRKIRTLFLQYKGLEYEPRREDGYYS